MFGNRTNQEKLQETQKYKSVYERELVVIQGLKDATKQYLDAKKAEQEARDKVTAENKDAVADIAVRRRTFEDFQIKLNYKFTPGRQDEKVNKLEEYQEIKKEMENLGIEWKEEDEKEVNKTLKKSSFDSLPAYKWNSILRVIMHKALQRKLDEIAREEKEIYKSTEDLSQATLDAELNLTKLRNSAQQPGIIVHFYNLVYTDMANIVRINEGTLEKISKAEEEANAAIDKIQKDIEVLEKNIQIEAKESSKSNSGKDKRTESINDLLLSLSSGTQIDQDFDILESLSAVDLGPQRRTDRVVRDAAPVTKAEKKQDAALTKQANKMIEQAKKIYAGQRKDLDKKMDRTLRKFQNHDMQKDDMQKDEFRDFNKELVANINGFFKESLGADVGDIIAQNYDKNKNAIFVINSELSRNNPKLFEALQESKEFPTALTTLHDSVKKLESNAGSAVGERVRFDNKNREYVYFAIGLLICSVLFAAVIAGVALSGGAAAAFIAPAVTTELVLMGSMALTSAATIAGFSIKSHIIGKDSKQFDENLEKCTTALKGFEDVTSKVVVEAVGINTSQKQKLRLAAEHLVPLVAAEVETQAILEGAKARVKEDKERAPAMKEAEKLYKQAEKEYKKAEAKLDKALDEMLKEVRKEFNGNNNQNSTKVTDKKYYTQVVTALNAFAKEVYNSPKDLEIFSVRSKEGKNEPDIIAKIGEDHELLILGSIRVQAQYNGTLGKDDETFRTAIIQAILANMNSVERVQPQKEEQRMVNDMVGMIAVGVTKEHVIETMTAEIYFKQEREKGVKENKHTAKVEKGRAEKGTAISQSVGG